ncbi:PHD finger protein rhinoceros-like [Zingiber officinale]|uniref:PHD finger protein rhinoceros-like n=1 Tax=Zingiber officinale TaxID=94328 RepID=UPI001C4BD822|nr:PHD finger protein rhinoceros-like [Zingiber officinale]
MEIVVSSIVQKRDLITLDLLRSNRSSKALGPPLKISSDNDDLPPLDLNRALDDDALRQAALPGSQSVCTIEKVKRALKRETERQRVGGGGGSASTSASPSPSSSSSSVTTASIRRRADRGDEGLAADGGDGDSASVAARGSLVVVGCPSCLSYVLIPKRNPRCPRCDARLAAASVLSPPPPPPPPPTKRPRIDLNFSLSTL